MEKLGAGDGTWTKAFWQEGTSEVSDWEFPAVEELTYTKALREEADVCEKPEGVQLSGESVLVPGLAPKSQRSRAPAISRSAFRALTLLIVSDGGAPEAE